MKNLFNLFLQWLFPPRCLFCQRVVPTGETCCPDCRERFLLPEHQIAHLSGEFTSYSAFEYREEGKQVISRFKFQGRRRLAVPIAKEMYRAIRTARGDFDFDVITWAPMPEKRRQERGYNQAELLARELSKLSGVPACEMLRTDSALTQHELSAEERRRNVEKSVYLSVPFLFAGRRILLTDDVITTGSTLAVCARKLKEAGAESVTGISAARRTKQPQDRGNINGIQSGICGMDSGTAFRVG